jgi:hypothetical protein
MIHAEGLTRTMPILYNPSVRFLDSVRSKFYVQPSTKHSN